jgi:hypothetical protein
VVNKPEDVELSTLDKMRILGKLFTTGISYLDDEDRHALCLVCGFLVTHIIWYYVLKHNSPANYSGFIPWLGTILSSFVLNATCWGAVIGLFMGAASAWEKLEGPLTKEFERIAGDIKKERFEKIDEELLGSDDDT